MQTFGSSALRMIQGQIIGAQWSNGGDDVDRLTDGDPLVQVRLTGGKRPQVNDGGDAISTLTAEQDDVISPAEPAVGAYSGGTVTLGSNKSGCFNNLSCIKLNKLSVKLWKIKLNKKTIQFRKLS